jgi:hypothetical protein
MVDTYFVANFEYRIATTAGVVDYLDADQPLTAWYHPTNFYDSNGWTPPVQRNGVGRYTVYVPSMINGIGPLSYQITSWGMNTNRCKIMSYPTANGAMKIWCHDQWGSSKDEHFHLTVTHKTNPMGEYVPPFGYARIRLGGTAVLDSYSTAGPAATVTAVGVGVYDVTWPSLSVSYGHAVAYAIGSSAEQCHVNWWGPNTVRLVCYKFTAPADQEVAVALSS